jgi:hypothetical protein
LVTTSSNALETIDKLALLFAGTPDDRVEASLSEFAERARKGWRETFTFLRAEESTRWLMT